ncbi:hypothetical protein CXG81DRAFT_27481 [Caulochytrium protostelioides]|uniref:F-box domain-containing protein n=1 Tax=Caulochytrium protostelioides TaxID=1555241 RepID=A0A4P9X417_9FUNG|nr:hypothetical protein CXG81DRAFT_27481 [Caulochytrium protostelioides]|eukprot:RKO99782.1 hypothetical protein CXG81DRAFT_27481 [Caulochytrium protostelioides]
MPGLNPQGLSGYGGPNNTNTDLGRSGYKASAATARSSPQMAPRSSPGGLSPSLFNANAYATTSRTYSPSALHGSPFRPPTAAAGSPGMSAGALPYHRMSPRPGPGGLTPTALDPTSSIHDIPYLPPPPEACARGPDGQIEARPYVMAVTQADTTRQSCDLDGNLLDRICSYCAPEDLLPLLRVNRNWHAAAARHVYRAAVFSGSSGKRLMCFLNTLEASEQGLATLTGYHTFVRELDVYQIVCGASRGDHRPVWQAVQRVLALVQGSLESLAFSVVDDAFLTMEPREFLSDAIRFPQLAHFYISRGCTKISERLVLDLLRRCEPQTLRTLHIPQVLPTFTANAWFLVEEKGAQSLESLVLTPARVLPRNGTVGLPGQHNTGSLGLGELGAATANQKYPPGIWNPVLMFRGLSNIARQTTHLRRLDLSGHPGGIDSDLLTIFLQCNPMLQDLDLPCGCTDLHLLAIMDAKLPRLRRLGTACRCVNGILSGSGVPVTTGNGANAPVYGASHPIPTHLQLQHAQQMQQQQRSATSTAAITASPISATQGLSLSAAAITAAASTAHEITSPNGVVIKDPDTEGSEYGWASPPLASRSLVAGSPATAAGAHGSGTLSSRGSQSARTAFGAVMGSGGVLVPKGPPPPTDTRVCSRFSDSVVRLLVDTCMAVAPSKAPRTAGGRLIVWKVLYLPKWMTCVGTGKIVPTIRWLEGLPESRLFLSDMDAYLYKGIKIASPGGRAVQGLS